MAKSPSGNTPPRDEVVADEIAATNSGKGHATPTRREREAANLRPLVQSDRKVANREARAKMSTQRERARIGMANGEERYLLLKDKGPQRRYVRDYVDARFSVGEILIPVLFLFVIISGIPGIAVWVTIGMYAYLLAAILDAVIAARLVTKQLNAKFGESQVQKVRWYTAMRCVQLRVMRMPKPQVKRRAYPS